MHVHLLRHGLHLQHILRHGLHAKLSKCRYLHQSVIFLGHRIDFDGIHPLKEKLKATLQAPAPTNI